MTMWRSLACAATVAVGPGMNVYASADDFLQHHWRQRILVVFSPSADDARARTLDANLADRACDLTDRDITVARVPKSGSVRIGSATLEPPATARLRRHYRVGPADFLVVLIGKDGGEKLRVGAVPSLDDVFAVIDSMPMRIAEMRAEDSRCDG